MGRGQPPAAGGELRRPAREGRRAPRGARIRSTSSTRSPAPTPPIASRCASSRGARITRCSRRRCSSSRQKASSRRSVRVRASRMPSCCTRPEVVAVPRTTARARRRSSCSIRPAPRCSSAGRSTPARSRSPIFTVMNDRLPLEGVLPMHCSANVGAGRRRRGLLRALRNRQDDALGRPRAVADRRRRARLGRQRRLQHRGRLLREGDPPVGGGRAGDLPHDAHLRHGARERRHRRAGRARSRQRRRRPRTRVPPTSSSRSRTHSRPSAPVIRARS